MSRGVTRDAGDAGQSSEKVKAFIDDLYPEADTYLEAYDRLEKQPPGDPFDQASVDRTL